MNNVYGRNKKKRTRSSSSDGKNVSISISLNGGGVPALWALPAAAFLESIPISVLLINYTEITQFKGLLANYV